MKRFLKNNIPFFIYTFLSLLLQLITIAFIFKKFYFSKPWLYFSFLLLIFSVYNLLKKTKTKRIFVLSCYGIECFICLFCLILYENTGTYFDYNMINLVREAVAVSSFISINYFYLAIVLLLFFSCYLGNYFISEKYCEKHYRPRLCIIGAVCCLFVSIISQSTIIITNNIISEKAFLNRLHDNDKDNYLSLGTSTSVINELSKLWFFSDYNKLKDNEIEEYIYSSTSIKTDYFGISKDNNLITILAESLEWFPLLNNSELYPNGSNFNTETINYLFPNLTKFYDMSIVMNNHYARNKTDMSEIEALLGILPNNKYVAYNYSNNNLITSISNSLKLTDPDIKNMFFHHNDAIFYDRENVIKGLGYDELYFSENMESYGLIDLMEGTSFDVLNLDSEMIDKMKDIMFPKNTRFNTQITTISGHGDYISREAFKRWIDKLDSLDVVFSDDIVKYYVVSLMEFDCALGILLEDLEKKDLLKNTTIVLFSDHNAYMNNLSSIVKNLYNSGYENYTELFRVPLMIYDPNIEHQIINKFTTTYDITPTILDMFGINYYSNLYYGNSIFSDEESVLYSKAFNVFLTDKLYFSNIDNLLYKDKNVDDAYLINIEQKCLILLKKIYYTNHLFEYDYFKEFNNQYIIKFKNLN